MSRSLNNPNWDEGQGFHYDFDSLVPVFPPSTHMLSPRSGWAGNIGTIEPRPIQSVQGFIPSAPIVSMIDETPRGMLPMAHGSNRTTATATSAGAPNQHITSNPRYTQSVNGAPFTSIDCTLASAADAGEHGPSPEVHHTVGRAILPPNVGQHRAIQKRSDAHKQYVSQSSTLALL